jgi:predicted dinucleotide-binding enzyme
LVKAFNTLPPSVISANPQAAGGHRVIFRFGNDPDVKQTVGTLIQRMGFASIDLGGLATGGRLQQFPGGTVPTLNLIKL